MKANSPYESTPADEANASSGRLQPKAIATGLFVIGLAVLGYGAVAFWLVQGLPPNGGTSGRLPSLYVMGIGIVITIVGLATRDLRSRASMGGRSAKGISTIYGVVGILAIIGLLLFVISRL